MLIPLVYPISLWSFRYLLNVRLYVPVSEYIRYYCTHDQMIKIVHSSATIIVLCLHLCPLNSEESENHWRTQTRTTKRATKTENILTYIISTVSLTNSFDKRALQFNNKLIFSFHFVLSESQKVFSLNHEFIALNCKYKFIIKSVKRFIFQRKLLINWKYSNFVPFFIWRSK